MIPKFFCHWEICDEKRKSKMSKNLIWLASYPKSGNTWVRAIINSALTNNENINNLSSLTKEFSNLVDNSSMQSTLKDDDVLAQGTLWAPLQRRISFELGKKELFVKTHNAAIKFNNEQFPIENVTSRVVYIVRDPRDVAVSYAHHFNQSLDEAIKNITSERNYISDLVTKNRFQYLSSWNIHVKTWSSLKVERLIIRYEDLHLSPQKEVKKLLDFLNINPMISINDIIKNTSFNNLKRFEKENGFKEAVNNKKFFRAGKIGDYKNHKNDGFKLIEKKFSEVMAKCNYL